MSFAYLDVHGKSRRVADLEKLWDAVGWYGVLLYRNGQIDQGYQVHNIETGWRLVVKLHGPRAHEARHHSVYAEEALQEVRSMARRVSRWVVVPRGRLSRRFVSWRRAPSFVLQVPWQDRLDVPLLHGGTGEAVAIYTLPVNDRLREDLVNHHDRQWSFLSIWLSSGALEIPAYRVAADIRGALCRVGRRLSAMLEHATGVPSYLEVYRYYNHKRNEERRPCPGCGGAWRRRVSGFGLAAFQFRCDRCRIVQLSGGSVETERLARIGEWRPGLPVEPARELIRQAKKGTIKW